MESRMTFQFKKNSTRMTALAERFASEAQMSLNKLLEAAVYALARRAAWQYTPDITKERMQLELEVAVQALEESELSAELQAALQTCLRNLKADKNILFEDAPDVYVCRTCGHAALGEAPKHCPDCGAWPGRFRKFVAFFNGDNQEPVNPVTVIDLLEDSVDVVKELTANLSEESMNEKQSDSEWSVREHMAHFFDANEMMENRIALMLQVDDPDFSVYSVPKLATVETGRRPDSATGIVDAYCRRRLETVEKLRSLSLNELFRTGWHPSFGQLTILRQAAYIANHEQDHMPEIEALCSQMSHLEK
jgi:rubrerythrin